MGIDANRLINALTVALIGCLIPLSPWSDNLYLTVSTLIFALLAAANHLFPERLARLTHVVKASYTHLLCASVAGPEWLPVATAVSVVDVAPLWIRRRAVRRASESVGAVARWGAIASSFVVYSLPWWLAAVFVACSFIYFRERRTRLSEGRRYDYGLPHVFEHVAVWAYLLTLNGERLNLPWVWKSSALVLVAVGVGLVITGVAINAHAFRNVRRSLPVWFDETLRPFILDKTRDNLLSHRLQHYVLKPFTPKMTTQRVRWSDIERLIAKTKLDGEFDAVVGVLSGGAFIARCVAEHHKIARVHYVRSRIWSNLSLHRNLMTSLRYYLGHENRPSVYFLDDHIALKNARVLVVDDSVCTGATLSAVEALCLERGAREVKTLALYAHPDHVPDYVSQVSMTPLIWPWGWEAD